MLPDTIKGKLALVLVVALAGMLLVSGLALYSEKARLLEDRKTKTRQLVETAAGVLGHFRRLEQAGELSAADARSAAIAAVRSLRYDAKEYFWINDLGVPVPRMVMHPTVPALDGTVLDAAKFNCATSLQEGDGGPLVETDGKTNLFVAFNAVANKAGDGYVTYLWPKPKQGGGTTEEAYPKLSYVKKFEPWGWVIGSGIYIDDVDHMFRARATTLGALSLGVAAAIAGLLWYLLRRISAPIERIKEAMKSIEATSDLSQRVAIAGDREIAEIGMCFNAMVGSFQELIRGVVGAAREVLDLTIRLAGHASRVAASSGEQTDASSAMAAAMEETRASIGQVAANSEEAHKIAEQAGKLSDRGKSIVDHAATEMSRIAGAVQDSAQHIQSLGEQSARISSIVNVIKEIADQTNLLALNAAIEAARAGEQGRGFAVVADEVRKLAERTTQSTQEISSTIASIQSGTDDAVRAMREGSSRVEGGVELAGQAGASMADIRAGADRVIGAVGDITQALHEQATATHMAADSVERIVAMAERNRAETEEIAEAAGSLESLAERLKETVGRFRV